MKHWALALMALMASPALADSGILPDPTITPGAVRTANIGEACRQHPGTAPLVERTRRQDHARVRFAGRRSPAIRGRPSIPLCLGGADDDRNRWAQPRRSIEPVFNAERKDELEARMCALACSGQLDIATAQKQISDDWTEAYKRFFREPSR